MNDKSSISTEEMLPEYDFSAGERGKYAARVAKGTNLVVFDADIAAAFPDAQSVNNALRALVRARSGRATCGESRLKHALTNVIASLDNSARRDLRR